MGRRSYENHALPYCFRSFARSKTSSNSCETIKILDDSKAYL